MSSFLADLFSQIVRLQGDTLADQKTSPSPRTTPEPSSGVSSPSDQQEKHSPGEVRHRSHSHSKKRASSAHHSHRSLTGSKSIDPDGHRGHHHSGGGHRSKSSGRSRGDVEEKRSRHDNHLKPSTQFSRTQSGSSVSSTHSRSPELPPKRSLSPPATINRPVTGYDMKLRNSTTSPPPPTSKPPPLPSNAQRMSGSRRMASDARWSNASFRSTDSASSEDSDLPYHARVYHGQYPDHTYVNRAWTQQQGNSQTDQPRYFPKAYSSSYIDQGVSHSQPSQDSGPMYVNAKSYQRTRPTSSKAGSNSPPMPSPPSENPHPLDNLVNEAYLQAPPPGGAGQRKTSHPLQNSLSRGGMTASGTQLSSYPWHNAQRRCVCLCVKKRKKERERERERERKRERKNMWVCYSESSYIYYTCAYI